jgi:hypothetical protein
MGQYLFLMISHHIQTNLISFIPNLPNNDQITYLNFHKKSIGSFNFIYKFAEHCCRLFNKVSTFLSAASGQPLLTFFFVIQMNSCYVKTVYASKLLFKLVPKPLALIINFLERLAVFRISPSYLHTDGHHRSGEGTTKRSLMTDPPSKPGGQLWKRRILYPQVILETQGNRFSSVKPLVEISLRFF